MIIVPVNMAQSVSLTGPVHLRGIETHEAPPHARFDSLICFFFGRSRQARVAASRGVAQ
jgi:hypothetical protein